jgi:hypothetical protein
MSKNFVADFVAVFVAVKTKTLEFQGFLRVKGGADGTRTRDPRRDRPIF